MRLLESIIPLADAAGPDRELVEKCLSGNQAAWEDLVRQHTRRVYRLCYRFTGKHSEAQELTQDVFLRVFQTLRSFRSAAAPFVSWLTRLTRNLLIDHYRRTRDNRVTWSIEEHRPIAESFVGAAEHPDRTLERREAHDLLQSVLTLLPPELRDPIVFYDLEEMSYRDIARVVGIPEGTVKSRLNRGRAELTHLTRKYRLAA